MSALASDHRWRTRAMRDAAGLLRSTRRSRPAMAAAANATSATPAANSPTVSRCHEKHFAPTVGSILNDGLKPATPQKAAGRMTDPPVWVPIATATMLAATAAAEPDDEPPGVCATLTG